MELNVPIFRTRIHPKLEQMKFALRKALQYIFPHYYSHGRLSDLSNHASNQVGGTSMDFYADSGFYFAFTVELPDLGQHGFLLPPSEIMPVKSIFHA